MEVENTKQLVSQFDEEKSQQVVAQILMIPWGHNIAIIQNAKPLVKLYMITLFNYAEVLGFNCMDIK